MEIFARNRRTPGDNLPLEEKKTGTRVCLKYKTEESHPKETRGGRHGHDFLCFRSTGLSRVGGNIF